MSNIVKAFIQNKKEHPAGSAVFSFRPINFHLEHEYEVMQCRIN